MADRGTIHLPGATALGAEYVTFALTAGAINSARRWFATWRLYAWNSFDVLTGRIQLSLGRCGVYSRHVRNQFAKHVQHQIGRVIQSSIDLCLPIDNGIEQRPSTVIARG